MVKICKSGSLKLKGNGTSLHVGGLSFIYDQNGSKLGTNVHTDPNDTKKEKKIFFSLCTLHIDSIIAVHVYVHTSPHIYLHIPPCCTYTYTQRCVQIPLTIDTHTYVHHCYTYLVIYCTYTSILKSMYIHL